MAHATNEDAPTPRKAFALATTWRTELRDCVELEVEEPTESLFSTAKWVSFKLSGSDNLLSKCDYARATTMVWFALSCCKGFRGTENPRFWQQVLSKWNDRDVVYDDPTLAPEEPADSDAEEGDLDEVQLRLRRVAAARARFIESTLPPPKRGVRFFPDEEKAQFPRIMLKVEQQSANGGIRTFLGLLPPSVDALGPQVGAILVQLAPFIREKHWRRRVAVGVDVHRDSQIEDILTDWLASE